VSAIGTVIGNIYKCVILHVVNVQHAEYNSALKEPPQHFTDTAMKWLGVQTFTNFSV